MIRAASRSALKRASSFSALPPTPRVQTTKIAAFSSSSLLPERTFWDTVHSGFKGLSSLLFSEDSRQEFMKIAEGSVINAEVLRRARFGNMLTMALFHDLQDPLFHRYKFNATDFLTGVKPALQNFHETIGQLHNEFPAVTSEEERTEKLLQRMHQIVASSMTAASNNNSEGLTLEENPWAQKAKEEPDSNAGRLTAMVSPKVLDSLFLTTETAAMLSRYQDGSATIANVALLSARVMEMDHDEEDEESAADNADTQEEGGKMKAMDETASQTDDKKEEKPEEQSKEEDATVKMESKDEELDKESTSEQKIVDGKEDETEGQQTAEKVASSESTSTHDEEENEDATPVAAQIEVLYEMNQKIDVKPEVMENVTQGMNNEAANSNTEEKPPATTTSEEIQVWVGTFEGWLNGGPDGGELRWKITRLRLPDSEFPGLYTGGYR